MRTVYVVSGGVSKFAKARPDKTFQAMVKEAYDAAIGDLASTSVASPNWLTVRLRATSAIISRGS